MVAWTQAGTVRYLKEEQHTLLVLKRDAGSDTVPTKKAFVKNLEKFSQKGGLLIET